MSKYDHIKIEITDEQAQLLKSGLLIHDAVSNNTFYFLNTIFMQDSSDKWFVLEDKNSPKYEYTHGSHKIGTKEAIHFVRNVIDELRNEKIIDVKVEGNTYRVYKKDFEKLIKSYTV